MGRITVKKLDPGVAWGSVHWQYLEDMSKVTPYEGTPLRLEKSLYTRQYTGKGPVLEPVNGPLAVGDELVVRIVLRTDRDMEYVHLKDHRASGCEPVAVLSQYKYQDGLGYYEATARHGEPFLHRLPAQGRLRVRVRDADRPQGQIPDGDGLDPVHVRPGVQQPFPELLAGSEVGCVRSTPRRNRPHGPGKTDHRGDGADLLPGPPRDPRRPCAKCQTLYDYAVCRLDRCPYGSEKPTCVRCPTHCYQPAMRAEIKEVMRYAGRRMLFRRPILALLHLLDARRKPPSGGKDRPAKQ